MAVPAQAISPQVSELGLEESALFLERVYERSGDYGESLTSWMDPDEVGNQTHTAILTSVVSEVLRKHYDVQFLAPEDVRQYYGRRLKRFIRAVEGAGVKWAKAILREQAAKTGNVRLVSTQFLANDISTIAKEISAEFKKGYVIPTMSGADTRKIVEDREGRKRQDIAARVKRMAYMRMVRYGLKKRIEQLEAASASNDAIAATIGRWEQPFRYLSYLMAHPDGVRIVDGFADEVKIGINYTNRVFNDCDESIRDSLAGFDESGLLWRCPPAIYAGLKDLKLARPGVSKFAFAWSARPSSVDSALETAMNALLLLSFLPVVGGIAGVLGDVLILVGTAVALVKEAEQDQLAEATTFASEDDKLSQGSRGVPKIIGETLKNLAIQHGIGLALKGVVKVGVALAERRAVQAITESAEKAAIKIPAPDEPVVPKKPTTSAKGLPDPIKELGTAAEKKAIVNPGTTKSAAPPEAKLLNKGIGETGTTKSAIPDEGKLLNPGISEEPIPSKGTTTAEPKGKAKPEAKNAPEAPSEKFEKKGKTGASEEASQAKKSEGGKSAADETQGVKQKQTGGLPPPRPYRQLETPAQIVKALRDPEIYEVFKKSYIYKEKGLEKIALDSAEGIRARQNISDLAQSIANHVVPGKGGAVSVPIEISDAIWSLPAHYRGTLVEKTLGASQYAPPNWFNIGALDHGFFPQVDFAGNGTSGESVLVSVKTADPLAKSYADKRIPLLMDHIDDIVQGEENFAKTRNGEFRNIVLDVRMPYSSEVPASTLEKTLTYYVPRYLRNRIKVRVSQF